MKNCIECKFWHFTGAWHGTDETPAIEAEAYCSCQKCVTAALAANDPGKAIHWSLLMNETDADEYRKALLTAETCKCFTPRPLENKA